MRSKLSAQADPQPTEQLPKLWLPRMLPESITANRITRLMTTHARGKASQGITATGITSLNTGLPVASATIIWRTLLPSIGDLSLAGLT